jgi:hypothetical protein
MSGMTRSGAEWILCLLGVVPALAAQQVFVVEASGLGDFTTLQGAVDAAATGDVIIVQSTDTAASNVTVIDGKGLTVVGRIPTKPNVPPIFVRNVPLGATVAIRHLTASPNVFNMGIGIGLEDSPGTVFLEEAVARGSNGDPTFPKGLTGMHIDNCDSVVMSRCEVHGGAGESSLFLGSGVGGVGLECDGGRISVTKSFVGGGAGGPLFAGGASGKPGGHGIDASGDYLYFSGTAVAGGLNGDCATCVGSDGLHLDGGLVQFVESTFKAGATGLGIPGQDIVAPPGSVQDLMDTSRLLEISALLPEGQTGSLVYRGAPMDVVAVFVSTEAGFLPLPSKAGVWQLGPRTSGPLPIGTADGSGELQITFSAPAIGPEGLTIFVQAVAQEATQGKLRIAGASALVVIDASL